MRHPNGDPIDVDKAAFDATVAEVREAYGLLVDFFGALGLNVDQIWDFLFLVGRVGAAESIRVRWPARARPRAGDRRASAGLVSRDDVEALNVLRAVDLLGGKSGAPSDVTRPRRARGPAQLGRTSAARSRWRSTATSCPCTCAPRTATSPIPDSKTPTLDQIARTAYTIDASNPPPDGGGTDEHISLTWIYVPATQRHAVQAALRRRRRHLATRGGGSRLRSRCPAAGASSSPGRGTSRPATSSAAVAAYGRADAKALEFGEQDGPHLDVETIQLAARAVARPRRCGSSSRGSTSRWRSPTRTASSPRSARS